MIISGGDTQQGKLGTNSKNGNFNIVSYNLFFFVIYFILSYLIHPIISNLIQSNLNVLNQI